ncbi:MAG: hypothetical protein E7474_09400 [Ruminococcaceae bacterium]|nr:hypothetical protein [Oscillospiraceae bacterium]
MVLHALQSGLGRNTGWEYSRASNLTRAAPEALIAELEGGTARSPGRSCGSSPALRCACRHLLRRAHLARHPGRYPS